jgi:hypothetical protein
MVRLAAFAAFVATAVAVPAAASAQEAGRYICSPGPDGHMSCVPEGAEGPAAPAPAAETPPPVRPAPDAPAPAPAPVPQADDRDEPGEAPIAAQLAPIAGAPAAPAAPATVYAVAPPPPPPMPDEDRKVSSRTHNWMMPTGAMLREGEAEISLHELIWAEAAYGISDRFEINAGMIGPMLMQVGARVGLTSTDSPFKLVVGGSAWIPMLAEDGFDDNGEGDGLHVFVTGTATAAYTTDRFSLHASALLAGNDDEDDFGAFVSVGVTLKLHDRIALIGEMSTILDNLDLEDSEELVVSFGGLKFMGRSTDVDFGFFVPSFDFTDDFEDDEEITILPMLSISHRF